MEIKTITGFKDVLPGETEIWAGMQASARKVFARFGYSEIILPIVEKTELFSRSIGGTTDIVEKEMYSFIDRDEDSITLRPEGTASTVRALIENNLMADNRFAKLFYMGPMFRHERPQKGRLRQFNQIGVELFGAVEPSSDAEVILMLDMFLREIGLNGTQTQLNSIGCRECRPAYVEKLREFLKGKTAGLCKDCLKRTEVNPLRTFDCKEEGCKSIISAAPCITDNLCPACTNHFTKVRDLLDNSGVKHVINPRIVRGLDYYTRTTFEVTAEGLGAQNAIAAGGRYDRLVAELGGPEVPGIGFAVGVERIAMLPGVAPVNNATGGVFIATLGDAAAQAGFRIASDLRKAGIKSEIDYDAKSLKSQMRLADKLKYRFTAIIGDNELQKGLVSLKDMVTKEQAEVGIDGLAEHLAGKLKQTVPEG